MKLKYNGISLLYMNFKKNANCLSVQAVRLENEIYRELGNPEDGDRRWGFAFRRKLCGLGYAERCDGG